jgi:hypothetical protein
MPEYGVVLFDTNTSAMRAEAVLARAKIASKMIPNPCQLSSDCGIALRFDWGLENEVRGRLASAHVEIAGIHLMPG